MKVKICGLKDSENIAQIAGFYPDYMGFIFYEKSPRYVGLLAPSSISNIPESIKKVGVFVNQSIEEVYQKARKYKLDYVQLHGYESSEYCEQLARKNIRLIKAFGIDDMFDFDTLSSYVAYCDLFVFDTATPSFGGSGRLFNWQHLKQYHFNTSFILSGGIGLADLNQINTINHPKLYGVDLNSKLEKAPGIKDINKTKLSIEITKKL